MSGGPNPVAALIVQPDGSAEIRDIDPTLDTLKELVGGWLEAIHPGDVSHGLWHAYIDEEGKLKQLPVNEAGTAFAHSIGWPHGDVLVGPVVFLGSGGTGEDRGAEEADVPPEVVGAAVRTWGLES